MTLDQLIQKRLAKLEMKRSELARGMGYAQDKLSKGLHPDRPDTRRGPALGMESPGKARSGFAGHDGSRRDGH